MDEQMKRLMEEAVRNADPKMVAKYGNPLDEDDPRTWTPSRRAEAGISLEDQVKFMGLDLEAQAMVIAKLVFELQNLQDWVAEKTKAEFLELLRTNPEAAGKQLAAMLDNNSYQTPEPYAGSVDVTQPDTTISTVNGPIRVRDIPGYRDDPEWKPSPDWIDANCTCPAHVAKREEANRTKPGSGDFPTGFYL